MSESWFNYFMIMYVKDYMSWYVFVKLGENENVVVDVSIWNYGHVI